MPPSRWPRGAMAMGMRMCGIWLKFFVTRLWPWLWITKWCSMIDYGLRKSLKLWSCMKLEARLGSFRFSKLQFDSFLIRKSLHMTPIVQKFLDAWMSGHICLRATVSPILDSELQAGQELQSVPGSRRTALFKRLSSHQTLGFCALAYPAIQIQGANDYD